MTKSQFEIDTAITDEALITMRGMRYAYDQGVEDVVINAAKHLGYNEKDVAMINRVSKRVLNVCKFLSHG